MPDGHAAVRRVEDERFYFVHSYAVRDWTLVTNDRTRAPLVTWAEHGGDRFVAAVENGPLSATQFHPEKSGDAGAALLRNWVGRCEPREQGASPPPRRARARGGDRLPPAPRGGAPQRATRAAALTGWLPRHPRRPGCWPSAGAAGRPTSPAARAQRAGVAVRPDWAPRLPCW